ncbi:MAG: protein translocase subunit SecF [Clostridiales bacterium]|nr:protein translocase subunit SecF [Clostridiales bacterium]
MKTELNFNFHQKRKFFYVASAVLLVVGLVSLIFQGLNQGIEFQSGTLMDLKFDDSAVSMEQVRQVLAEYGLENSSITLDSEGTYVIKSLELSEETQTSVMASFLSQLGGYDMKRIESVGPIVGKELTQNAIIALSIASALMLVYISIRFQWKFAVAAILCLVHDSLIMLGFFSLFQFEVESSFIAAVLTTIGYSINNTIVVFDRIRENMKLNPKWKGEELINRSINQTLIRSINLAMTVALVLGALIILGGKTTRVFAIALMVGNISGFYSSAFISGNLWLEFKPDVKTG